MIFRGFQADLEHQRAMRSNARALVAQRRGSEGGDGQAAMTQAARMVTAFMENSFPNFLEGRVISFHARGLISSRFVLERETSHTFSEDGLRRAGWLELKLQFLLFLLVDGPEGCGGGGRSEQRRRRRRRQSQRARRRRHRRRGREEAARRRSRL